MDHLREFITTYNIEIIISLMAAFIILVLLYLISQIRISRIKKKYNEVVRGIEGVNVEELLIRTGEEVRDIYIDINNMEKEIEGLNAKLALSIQKVGFIRYNAFAEMGSELSFSIALLDDFKNGFILTSIYGRDYTTSYAKQIKLGKSIHPLSVEEIQAIDRAIIGEYKEKAL